MALLENLRLKQLKEKREAYKEELAAEANKIVCEVFDAFFEKAGEKVEAVRWTQYTPYFNDGDTCTFNVYDACFKFKEGDEEAGEDGDGFVDAYGDDFEKLAKGVKTVINELQAFLGENEDLLEAAFGDHALITATKDGIENDEYDHD